MNNVDTNNSNEATVIPQGKGSVPKFVILSIIGIFVFFIPILDGQVPLVLTVNFIKKSLDSFLPYVALLICASLLVTVYLGKVKKMKFFADHHAGDGPFRIGFYVLGLITTILIITKTAPAFILDPEVGGLAVSLASTIFLTVTLAGWMVSFILDSGIVEFIAVLVEPIMRPIYKLPGEAAVDAVSAFVSSAAVGVYITDQHYLDRRYTHKEAYCVVTSFCVMSVGYLGVVSGIANVSQYFSQIVIAAFSTVMIMAAIMIRIPPLSFIPNTYVDGKEQTKEEAKAPKRENRFRDAVDLAVKQSRHFSIKSFFQSLKNAICFAQKITGFLVPIVALVLAIYYYTPFFQIIGTPMVPILNLVGMPDAVKIAPSTLVGIVDVTLPAITVADPTIAPMSAFFIVVLSAVQIVFFTESANAMLEAHFKVKIPHLIAIFATRTLIAIPIVAVFAHLFF